MLFGKVFILVAAVVAPGCAFRQKMSAGAQLAIQAQAKQNAITNSKDAAAVESGIVHVVAAQAGIRRARATAARAERTRRAAAKRRRDEEQRQARIAADNRKKAHYSAHVQHCKVSEEWSESTQCSAACGGGMATTTLLRRTIIQARDTFNYGNACPALCNPDDPSACGEQKYGICNMQICDTDCSIVDLGNRLPAGGSSVAWNFQQVNPEDKGCVFQLWQILEEDADRRLKLLGETLPMTQGGPETIYKFSSSETLEPLMINAFAGRSDIALGFRGCELKGHVTDMSQESIARICLHGSEGFQQHRQVVELDAMQHRYLSMARRESREGRGIWAGQLATLATRERGLSAKVASTDYAGLHIGTGEPEVGQYMLSVQMAVSKPGPPEVYGQSEVGDDMRLHFEATVQNNGAEIERYSVQVRKLFGEYTRNNGGHCEMIPLRPCDPLMPGQPCVEWMEHDHHSSPVLRNLALASKFHVGIAAISAAGQGKSAQIIVTTRALAGIPLSKCRVDQWECGVEDETSNQFPEADEEECQLATPSYPVCRMHTRHASFPPYKAKCTGKKYWQECKPLRLDVLWHGIAYEEASCAAPDRYPVKVCAMTPDSSKALPLAKAESLPLGAAAVGDSVSADEKCEVPGCKKSNSFFALFGSGNKHCCCSPGQEGDFADQQGEGNPQCACEKKACSKLGLTEAANADRSCRH